MKKLVFILLLLAGTNSFGKSNPKTAQTPTEFIPPGYIVFEEIHGDLNNDNQVDYVFIIKGTDKDKFTAVPLTFTAKQVVCNHVIFH